MKYQRTETDWDEYKSKKIILAKTETFTQTKLSLKDYIGIKLCYFSCPKCDVLKDSNQGVFNSFKYI